MRDAKLTLRGLMSWSTRAWRPLRMRFAETVFRSLAARISSMMTVYVL